jgi:diacylglycerol kinase (ATP)
VLAVESAPAAAGRRGIDVSPAGAATDSPGASEALRDGQATPEPELRQPGQSAELPLRSAVVINPARVQDLPERRRLIESAIAAAGWPAPTWWETTPDDPGTGQARRAVELGAEVVFVCGGDGTVRSAGAGLVGTDSALAVLPAGTGNLLAMNLGLPDDPAAGVRLAVERGRRRLDVGQVDGQMFAVMAGMGFDAAMMDDASTSLKARIGPAAYVVSALRHLLDRSMRVEIRIDDEPSRRCRARTVLVGNVGRLQSGIRLLKDAEPDSGVMEVAVIAPRHLGHWLALAWGVLLRRSRVPQMEVLRGNRIRIVSDQPQPRELDGDVIDPGSTLDVTVLPGALWLCVPQPDQSPDLTEGAPRG